MEALIDTATDFIAVNGLDCHRCDESTIYDIESNYINGIATLELGKNVTEPYGGQEFKGILGTDQLCFTLGNCFNFKFLYVSQSSIESAFSMVLGFARPGKNFLYGVDRPMNSEDIILSKLANMGEE